MSKIFLDTNIFVYASDTKEKSKQQASRALLAGVDGRGVISTQVLQEFYVTATRKLHMDPLAVKGIIASMDQFEIVAITPALIHEAIDCHLLSRISFWDAMVVVAAASARCEMLYSEDLIPGQIIRGVRVQNPMKAR